MSEQTTKPVVKKPNDNVELGALWQRESSQGKYLSGTINLKGAGLADKAVFIVIFSNKFKKAENQPDLRIYLSKPKPVGSTPAATKAAPVASAPLATPEQDDNII